MLRISIVGWNADDRVHNSQPTPAGNNQLSVERSSDVHRLLEVIADRLVASLVGILTPRTAKAEENDGVNIDVG